MAQTEQIEFPTANDARFKMIDVGRKRPTRRRAVAVGSITMGEAAFERIKSGTLPKGDVLALAEAAGMMGAKKTPDLIPMCHTLPMDQVTVHCTMNDDGRSITVYCQAAAFAKTGVEMEALAGVNIALLTIWDLTKGIDTGLEICDVKLLVKVGGKSGIWINKDGIPDWLIDQLPSEQVLTGLKVGVVVMSDRASSGTYEDKSGIVLMDILEYAGADLIEKQVIADDFEGISKTLRDMCIEHQPDLIIASGGTGPGPRDVTPQVLEEICERILDGLGDYMRGESLYFTDTAWLSRMSAGMCGSTLIVTFPGSPNAVKECWDIIAPFIGDALVKIKKQGFAPLEAA